MNTRERAEMLRDIEAHGARLQAMFPRLQDRTADQAARAVNRIETAAHRDAELWCNGDIGEDEAFRREAATLDRLDRLTGWRGEGWPVYFNHDPRGVALKIDAEKMRLDGLEGAELEHMRALCERTQDFPRDWGGDYMLSPNFSR